MATPTHFVFLLAAFTGHARPTINLCCNLLKLRPGLKATVFYHKIHNKFVEAEIARHGLQNKINEGLLVLIGAGEEIAGRDMLADGPDLLKSILEVSDVFATGYSTLFEQPVPPHLAIIDIALALQIPTKMAIEAKCNVKHKVPTLMFAPVPAGYLLEHVKFMLEKPLLPEYAQHPCRKNFHEIYPVLKGEKSGHELWTMAWDVDSEPLQVDGAPPMYPREWCVQKPEYSVPPDWIDHMIGMCQLLVSSVDGLIIPFDETLEAEGAKALSKATDTPILNVGPQFNEAFWSNEGAVGLERAQGFSVEQFTEFLDKFPAHSVLYISFGSTSVPRVESQINAVFEALLDAQPPIPFIFSSDPLLMPLSTELSRKLKARSDQGLGLVAPWCPQQTILRHPSTDFFLSHGGSGSMHESIAAGVPMIVWPVAHDQPYLGAWLTVTEDVSFELVQPRDDICIGKPIAGDPAIIVKGTSEAIRDEARGVFQEMRGPVGERKRNNMKALQEKMKASHNSGESDRQMRELSKMGDI
ncbi:hypothetical protein B0H19DRAFT_1080789 [Mycena capillaripes]|nr:hypothetical protein B0H19DRAFT_1080789 [Mycena capillaripes]